MKAPGQVQFLKRVGLIAMSLIILSGLGQSILADHASGTYRAAQVLGQPDFTTGLVNAEGIPNDKGFGVNRKIALDPVHHRLFTAEYGNSRVLVYNLDDNNHFTDQTADFVLGQPDFNSRGAAATQNGMQAPAGVTYDAKHDRLFVGDQGNARVLVYELSGGITNGMNAANVLGQPDFTTKTPSGTPAGAQGLDNPMGLAYDPINERLFVTSYSDGRVMVWDFPGGVITSSVNANYAIGTGDINTVAAKALPNQNKLFAPAGVALDLATDASGIITRYRLFVANYGAGRVTMYDLLGGISTGMPASLVLGKPDFNGGTHATNFPIDTGNNDLLRPVDVSYDQENSRLFVGEYGAPAHNRVLTYDLSGTPTNGQAATHVIGKDNFNDTNDGPAQNRLGATWGVVYDPTSKQLLVSDIGNYRILAFDIAGGVSTGMPAARVLGQTTNDDVPTFTKNQKDNVHVRATAFNGPTALALDPARHLLFVGDSYNRRVLVYQLDGANTIGSKEAVNVLGQPDFITNQQWPTAANTFNSIGALQYDSVHNRLFVTDNYLHRVLVFDLSNGVQNNMNAANVLGQADFVSGSAATSAHSLNTPLGLALNETTEELFVADQGSNRIMSFNLKNGVVNGMAAANVIGQADFTATSAGAASTQLNRPLGLMYDSSEKRLFAADYANCRVLAYNLSAGVSNGMPASNVIGQADFTPTPDCTPTNKTFGNQVSDVSYDSLRQSLFVSDASANRIVKFKLDKGVSNGMEAAAVLGQHDFASTTANAPDGKPNIDNFSYPRAMVHDDQYRGLFVADFYNNRVLQIDFIRMVDAPLSQLLLGEEYDATLSVQQQGNTNFSLVSGSIPDGLTLNQQTGELVGTTQKAGLFTFTIEGQDDNRTAGVFRDVRQYSLDVKGTETTIVTHGAGDEPAGIHGNPASHTASGKQGLTRADGVAEGTCQVIINLDEQPDFQNGSGYKVDVNNCYMLRFSATEENGETKKYSVTVDTVGDKSVDLSVTPEDAVHQPIAHLIITPGGTRRVAPSPWATTSLQIKANDINRPTASLEFARAAKHTPATKTDGWMWWLLILFIILALGFFIFFAWKRRKDEEDERHKKANSSHKPKHKINV